MARQRITFASGLYDRFLALYTKEVEPEGIDLDFTVIDSPREIFREAAASLGRIDARQVEDVALIEVPAPELP